MWHMNWLGDVIGELGGEPRMEQGVYPHDPTSNASLLRSYIAWEENLVGMYPGQANKVDHPEIKRMLLQQGLESETHRKRFAEWLAKLGPSGEEPFEYGETPGFSPAALEYFKRETGDHYKLVLQHLRHAFVFEDQVCPVGSGLELSAMRHMKHLSHFAEELAEAGQELAFDYPGVDMNREVMPALESDLALTEAARQRLIEFDKNPELAEHTGLRAEVENMITRNEFLALTVEELMEEAEQAVAKPEPPAPPDSGNEPSTGAENQFTVGSLMDK
jgi:hypothetical protein